MKKNGSSLDMRVWDFCVRHLTLILWVVLPPIMIVLFYGATFGSSR